MTADAYFLLIRISARTRDFSRELAETISQIRQYIQNQKER